MNKQQLAAKIWASANKMRSKIEANEYKDYILGFIFYKFLSDKEVQFLKSKGITEDKLPTITEDKADRVRFIQQNLGYFIAYENLFSHWLEIGRDFTAANVRDALSAFNRLIHPNNKKLFDRIFDTLQTGLSKLGTGAAEQNQAVRDLVCLIQDIPTDGKQDYDVLGFVYEYLISNFAANAGKKAGEFYTPHEVSVMMSDIIAYHLKGNDEIRIYDPTSGSGSLLINIGKSVARHISNKDNIKYYAQELKQNTYNLTRMNLIMRGINPSNIEARNGDTLKEDWPYFDENDPAGTYDPLYVDAVVSNPPYSQEWDPTDQESDPRYADFGLAPKGTADYAFLLHDLYHVKPEGIMTIVLPHGVLYRGGTEADIRKALVEKNHIDAIIGLPEKVFFGTGISTIVMVLKRAKSRQDTSILFVDASRGFEKDGKNNKLRECDIRKIVDVVTQRKEVEDFSRLISRETIRENEYNLNISRYVDSSDKAEHYDIYATMFGGIPKSEIMSLSKYWEAFLKLMDDLFSFNELGYATLRSTNDLSDIVRNNNSVQCFCYNYEEAFEDYHEYLHKNLVQTMFDCNIQQKNDELTSDLFTRVAPFTHLVDKYQAFQFFSNDWKQIQNDLEIIQTEGEDAFREIEVDDETGKEDGRLLPFDIVQRELLSDLVYLVESYESRLAGITDRYTELLEAFTPDELEKQFVNEDHTKFVPGEVKKEIKRILDAVVTDDIELLRTYPSTKKEKEQFIKDHPNLPWSEVEPDKNGGYGKTKIDKMIAYLQDKFEFEADSYEAKVKEVYNLQMEEKKIKDELGKKRNELYAETRAKIHNMDRGTAMRLMDVKWTTPLCESLSRMPEEVVHELVDCVHHLVNKYATTYQDIASRIQSAESRLYALLGELEANKADMLGLNQFRQTLNA